MPGEGNNRLLIIKLVYLAAIAKANGDESKISDIDKHFTFYGHIRNLPKEINTTFAIDFLLIIGQLVDCCIQNISCHPENWLWRVQIGDYSFGEMGGA